MIKLLNICYLNTIQINFKDGQSSATSLKSSSRVSIRIASLKLIIFLHAQVKILNYQSKFQRSGFRFSVVPLTLLLSIPSYCNYA